MSTNNNHCLNGQQKEIRLTWKSEKLSVKKLSVEKLSSLATTGIELKKITALPLPSCGIEKIENLEVLSELRRLDLSSNQIKRLSGMQGLSKLSMLNLSGNQLDGDKSLEDLRYLNELRTLNIGENEKLRHINSHIMKPLQKLQALIAHQCGFEKASFVRFLPQLNTLVLSRNRLIQLHAESCVNLTKLSLGHNKFTEWPELSTCPHLQELRLNNNQLTTIPHSILQIRKLKIFDISHNSISEWDDIKVLSSLKSLTNLCVKGNPLPRPNAEAKAIVLREDISSDSITDENELLYRRYILSFFQSNVGEKGLPKIQLIVLDMKRVKIKFSHTHQKINPDHALSSSLVANTSSHARLHLSEPSPNSRSVSSEVKHLKKRHLPDSNITTVEAKKDVKKRLRTDEVDEMMHYPKEDDDRNICPSNIADIASGQSSMDITDSGVVSAQTVIGRSKQHKSSEKKVHKGSFSSVVEQVQVIDDVLQGSTSLLNDIGKGGSSAW
jgi:hypothetical protein